VREPPVHIPDDSPPLWEQWAAGFVIFMLTGALIAPVIAPTQVETPILRFIWLPVYAVIAGLIVFHFDKVIRAWPAWLMMFALVALCFVSKYWSIDPEVTERRVIAMAINSAFAIYLGARFRDDSQHPRGSEIRPRPDRCVHPCPECRGCCCRSRHRTRAAR